MPVGKELDSAETKNLNDDKKKHPKLVAKAYMEVAKADVKQRIEHVNGTNKLESKELAQINKRLRKLDKKTFDTIAKQVNKEAKAEAKFNPGGLGRSSRG